MNKKFRIFIAACMLLCLIPSVGMLFFPTTETTENRAMTELPALFLEDGSFNKSFLRDLESCFNERIALRNQMVSADAKLQNGLFHQSNVSGVITGTDGWLYYASTLNDYLGTDVLSPRELTNLAHNFSLIQQYLEQKDIDFVLTIAPNKNSLYGEHMPYYNRHIVNNEHSAELLLPYLADEAVNYLDLFALFREQPEVLYLKGDSHWNNKGACLAYNGLMDALQLKHEDYSKVEPVEFENRNGDLNRMLYSFYGGAETDYDYQLTEKYAYTGGADNVEDGWIVTDNPKGQGTLLMFRDSFANTLIPFFSAEFKTACYSKGEPNALERYVDSCRPDCVVIEKVERNIANYLENPPILTPASVELPRKYTIAQTQTTLQLEDCLNDVNYYKISGILDDARLTEDARILISVNGKTYPAYHTGENGYLLYLKKSDFPTDEARIKVFAVQGDECLQLTALQWNQ